MQHELFVCKCEDVEHQIIFSWFDEPDEHELYAAVHLAPVRNPLKRIWYAIKYIFGYKCKYGAFEEFIFRVEDIWKLRKLADILQRISLC